MTEGRTRRGFLRVAGTGAVAGLAGCVNVTGSQQPEEQARSHAETLSKYDDVAGAVSDGYQMTTPYVRTDDGVLGVPFVNLDVPKLDPDHPTVLFYDLREDGTYELLGAEWLVRAESADSPPSMFGKQFHGPTPGETAFIPKHYGLHVWLFDDEQDDLFATYDAAAKPPSYIADLETAWNALTPYYGNATKARKAGYTNTEKCIATSDGGYGVPVVDTSNAGTDLSEPPVLLYRLSSNWSYRLLGAEWYVPADSTDSPPSLFGRQFGGPMDGHSPKSDQPEHYGLHAWLFYPNPRGTFERYNPLVRC